MLCSECIKYYETYMKYKFMLWSNSLVKFKLIQNYLFQKWHNFNINIKDFGSQEFRKELNTRYLQISWQSNLLMNAFGFSWNKTNLENAGSIGRSPCIQQVIFACCNKPLARVCKLEWQHTTFMQVKLILVWFRLVKNFHIAVLHSKEEK